MKVIKQGVDLKNKEVKAKCHRCKTVFTYTSADIQSDFRDGPYVVCPNENCKSFIAAKYPKP